jgi:molybdopterin-guanine dinucleotide biosynthesis protein A
MSTPGDAKTSYAATVIILAGGRGARMGGVSKAFLPWGEGTLLEHVVAQARAAAEEVVVVGDGVEPPAGSTVVVDVFSDAGPLGGLHAGLQAARFERCLAVGCDMPFVTAAVMRALLDLGLGYDAAVPRTEDGLHPLLAAYARADLPVIEEQLVCGERRMAAFLDRVRVRWVSEDELRGFDPNLLCLFNINTRRDYREALEIAGEMDR